MQSERFGCLYPINLIALSGDPKVRFHPDDVREAHGIFRFHAGVLSDIQTERAFALALLYLDSAMALRELCEFNAEAERQYDCDRQRHPVAYQHDSHSEPDRRDPWEER